MPAEPPHPIDDDGEAIAPGARSGTGSVSPHERRDGAGHFALLGLVLILAGALRTVDLGRESLWADEALTLVLAHWPAGEMLMQPTDPTPFLYYFLHKLLVPAGAGVEAARAISVAAGLLSVAAMYLAGRLAFGPRAGLLAAALLAVWGAHVDYSQEARAYSLLFLLTLGSAAGLLWWFRESGRSAQALAGARPARRLALALFALTTVLAFYTHLVSIFWTALALQILVSLTLRTRPKECFAEAAAAMAAMALLAAPGLVRLAREIATPDAFYWLAQAGPVEFLGITADVLLPEGLGDLAKAALGLALVGGLTLLLVRAGAGLFARHSAAAAVTLAFLALPLLLWLFGYVGRPLFMPRTILIAIPGMILLIVAAIGLLPGARIQRLAAAGAIAAYLVPTLLLGTTRDKEEWRGANAVLVRHVRPGDLILVCPSWKYPALRHAAERPVPAAAMVSLAERPLLLEPGFGSDEAWAATYFASVTEPVMRRWIGGAVPRHRAGRMAAAQGATAWLVASECSDQERGRLLRWLGGSGAWTEVWRSPAGPNHAGITISRAAAPAAVRPVMLARHR